MHSRLTLDLWKTRLPSPEYDQSGESVETYRPSYLPPKPLHELQRHAAEVHQLDGRFRNFIKNHCVVNALQQLHEDQKAYRVHILQELWMEKLFLETTDCFSKGIPLSENVKRVWRQGLPPRVRRLLWPLAVGNILRITPNLYHICLQKYKRHQLKHSRAHPANHLSHQTYCEPSMSDVSCSSTVSNKSPNVQSAPSQTTEKLLFNYDYTIEHIAVDVPRTFPTLKVFQKSGSLYSQCINILGSWVCYRPDLGYVQGMSFLAGLLLVYVDQFPAFVCLCNLLSLPTLMGMYKMERSLIEKRYEIFEQLLHIECSEVYSHLSVYLNFPKDIFLLEWFLTLFSKPLSIDVSSHIWDLYFLDGEIILYSTAVAILKLIKQHILPPVTVSAEPRHDHEETQFSDAFNRARHALANIRNSINDAGILVKEVLDIVARIPESINAQIRSIGCSESVAIDPTKFEHIFLSQQSLDKL